MAAIVYILCTVTALLCAALLVRGYLRSRTRLLFWSALCFVGLTINNGFVFVDLVVFPQVSLFTVRSVTGVAAVLVLLVGLVQEVRGAR